MAVLHGLKLGDAVKRALGLKSVAAPVQELYETVQPVYEVRRLSQLEDRHYHGQSLCGGFRSIGAAGVGVFSFAALQNPNNTSLLCVTERLSLVNFNVGNVTVQIARTGTNLGASTAGFKRDTRQTPNFCTCGFTNGTLAAALPNPIYELNIPGSGMTEIPFETVISPGFFLAVVNNMGNQALVDVAMLWHEIPLETSDQNNP